jgi:hypothetical protein
MSCSIPTRLLSVGTSRAQRTSTSTGVSDGVTVARIVRGPTSNGGSGREAMKICARA